MNYIFNSTGGCAICDDMPNEHEEYPVRPHPYCDCKIVASSNNTICFTGEFEWDYNSQVEQDGGYVKIHFTLELTVTVNCLKTQTSAFSVLQFEDTINVKNEYFKNKETTDGEILGTWVANEGLEEMRALGAENCDCNDKPTS